MKVELPKEMVLCLDIYEKTLGAESEGISFSELEDSLDGVLTGKEISAYLDYLFDLGMINGRWSSKGGVWARRFYISGEARGFVESAYAVSSSE